MNYETPNKVKSSFHDVYHGPTPHAYFNEMQRLEYGIGGQAKPYFKAVAEHLRRQLNPGERVRLLDLGCSYGVGAALLNYDFSFSELAGFFADRASTDYEECLQETRELFSSKDADPVVECVGVDASEEAIQFATESGLIQSGITNNLEQGDRLGGREAGLIKQCHLLTSTGAIGYVGEKTLTPILQLLGKGLQLRHGPYVVVTILRMFDPERVVGAFSQSGYKFVRVPGVNLRQRHFDGQRECDETLELLIKRGIDPEGLEADGHLYADLFAGAPEKDLDGLVQCLQQVHLDLESATQAVASR